MTANYLLWAIVKPSQLILLAAVLALVFRRRPFGRRCAAATAALVVLFGLSPIGPLLIRPLETRFEIPAGVSGLAGVIVLAGSERGTLSQLYAQPQLGAAGDRLTTFLMLAEEHPNARLVHSGSSDTATARAVILGAGVAPSRVLFEDRSRNSCESAHATRALVEPRPAERWVVVTSAFHMPRAVACFRAADWDVIPYPADFRSGALPWHFELVGNLESLDLAAHEWLGLAYYRLRGFTRELFPAPTRL